MKLIKLLLRDGSGLAGDVRIQREILKMVLTVKLQNTLLSILIPGRAWDTLKAGPASVYLLAVVSFKAASTARVQPGCSQGEWSGLCV